MISIFIENISSILSSRCMTQEQLAIESKISRQTINKLLQFTKNNGQSIKLSTAINIAESLNVDFPKLFSRLDQIELRNIEKFNNEDYLSIFIENVILLNHGSYQNRLSYEYGVFESTISDILNKKTKDPNLSTLISIWIGYTK